MATISQALIGGSANENAVRRWGWLALLAILLLAAALRFYRLDAQSFWADEGNSLVLAGRSPNEIVAAAAADIHPPAYYLLLKLWARALGLSETGARSLSAFLGVVLVGGLFLLGRDLAGRRVGLFAGALAAVNPLLVYYSQEARMYELAALCAVLAAWLALPGLSMRVRNWLRFPLAYSLCVALGLYTHYAFGIFLIALNLVFLAGWWRARRAGGSTGAGLGRWTLAQMAPLLLFGPWLPTAFRQLTQWPQPAVTLVPGQALAQTLELFVCGPIPCLDAPLLIVLAGLGLALALVSISPWPRPRPVWPSVILPLVWLLTPVGAMLIFDLFTPAFFKFLVLAIPAFLLLAALGIERLANRWAGVWAQRLVIAGLVLLLMASALPPLVRYYFDPAVARDDYRGIAAYLQAVAGPNDAIILVAPGQIDAFGQYDHGPAAVYPLPTSRPLDPVATRSALDRIVAARGRIYAIFWATSQADPDGVIEAQLAGNTFKAWDSWVGNLRFVAYSAEPPPTPTPFPQPPRFGDQIDLQAAGVSDAALQPGDIARVLLRWQAHRPLHDRYKVTLQLLDPMGQVVAQVDSEPVGGTRPTTAWAPNQPIDDPYGLPVPLGTPPGEYQLILALYDAATGARLPVAAASGPSDHLALGNLAVALPTSPPPAAILPIRHRAETQRGPFTFLGHDRFKQGFGHAPATPLAPGDMLHLTTFWRADAPPAGDYAFDVWLDGRALGRFALAGPTYPTHEWAVGFPWRGEHTITLPPDLAGGRGRLALQLVDPAGQVVGDSIVLQPRLVY